MKKYLIFLLTTAIGFPLSLSGQERVPLEASIEKVTVFLNGAEVTRSGGVGLAAGKNTVELTGLSSEIDQQSIQVGGQNTVKILSVLYELDYLSGKERNEKIEGLEAREQAVADEIEGIKNSLSVYASEEDMIVANQSTGSGQQGVRSEDVRQLADFYRQRLLEVKALRLEKRQELRVKKRELLKINRQLAELNARRDQPVGNIIIRLESARALQASLEVSYLVKNAGWAPSYDVRVDAVNGPITMTYKARVYQQTGNAWKDVALTLSTADPSQSGTIPELAPWHLNFASRQAYGRFNNIKQSSPGTAGKPAMQRVSGRVVSSEDGSPLPGVNVTAGGGTYGTVTDPNGNYAFWIPQGSTLTMNFVGMEAQRVKANSRIVNVAMHPSQVELDEVVVAASGAKRRGQLQSMFQKQQYSMEGGSFRQGPMQIPAQAPAMQVQASAVFAISEPQTIPSDGKSYAVEIKDMELPAEYEYYAAPKLDPDAFLVAKIIDWEQFNLLEGEMNLFLEGVFVGNSQLVLNSTTDTLQLSLGRDKDINVRRTKLRDHSENRFIGGKRKISRSYKIEVRNTKQAPIFIILEDQFPLSQHEDITVTPGSYSGGKLNPESKILSWGLKIEPQQSETIKFNYSVEFPKDKHVQLGQ